MIRRLLRHQLLNAIVAIDKIAKRERLIQDRKIVQVVNFHHLYEREEEPFRKFLQWLGQHYQIISYTDAVQRIVSGDIDRPYAAITFDDGLESNFAAAEILKQQGISATFFVCPEIIGVTEEDKLSRYCQSARMFYESNRFVSWAELDQMIQDGHEVGCHTMTHPVFNGLSADRVDFEIQRATEILADRFGDIKHFSWPLGRFDHLGIANAASVVDAGFMAVASGHRGAHGRHQLVSVPFPCIRRDNLEARWPLSHIKHFLIGNAVRPIMPKQWWPENWQIPDVATAL